MTSYNPLKMWGSYVGLILVGLFAPIGGGLLGESTVFEQIQFGRIFEPLTLIFFSITGILGFLIGWGIHSLFRRFFD